MYKLYVIPGSHACRAAMLMLDQKQVPYRRVDFVTLTHPLLARLHGFDAGGQTRVAGRHRTLGIRFGDRLATVPGLAAGEGGGNKTLQMAARRILGIAAVRDPAGFARSVGDGRMGHLLYGNALVR